MCLKVIYNSGSCAGYRGQAGWIFKNSRKKTV